MGGRTGGWDPRDHDSFLKVLTVVQAHGGYSGAVVSTDVERGGQEEDEELHVMNSAREEHGGSRKVSVNPQFVSKFVTFLPGKTVDEIEEHIIW